MKIEASFERNIDVFDFDVKPNKKFRLFVVWFVAPKLITQVPLLESKDRRLEDYLKLE